ncbi:MAG TPA: amidohydrolase family protein [Pirellulaceae bacterium]|nr:amidohydrolase family protein [Pirellulaceae bacterium]
MFCASASVRGSYAGGGQCVLALGLAAALLLGAAPLAQAQDSVELPLDGRDGRQLLLENFRPRAMLKVQEHHLTRARFPVVDVHTHFRIRTRHSPEQLEAYVQLMDRNQVAVCVSLDGTLGDPFDEHLKYLGKYRDRFVVFANIDFQGAGKADEPATWDVNQPDFVRRVVEQLKDAHKRDAAGLKLFKEFGLSYRNADGSLIAIDDPRFDPIWQACGELKMPVLIHTADPAAFFLPIDERNERWEELHRRPEWSFHGDKFPKREELLAALLRVVQRHPRTTFIGAHVANNAEDLKTVSRWLEKSPNLHVEIASRISELGRQPYTARAFFLKHQDRILFGTDGPWPEERLRLYWRFLETYDEYFPYSEKEFPPQGLWNICGVGLPEEVLRKVYYENAQRLIPGVKERLERFRPKAGGSAEQ